MNQADILQQGQAIADNLKAVHGDDVGSLAVASANLYAMVVNMANALVRTSSVVLKPEHMPALIEQTQKDVNAFGATLSFISQQALQKYLPDDKVVEVMSATKLLLDTINTPPTE